MFPAAADLVQAGDLLLKHSTGKVSPGESRPSKSHDARNLFPRSRETIDPPISTGVLVTMRDS